MYCRSLRSCFLPWANISGDREQVSGRLSMAAIERQRCQVKVVKDAAWWWWWRKIPSSSSSFVIVQGTHYSLVLCLLYLWACIILEKGTLWQKWMEVGVVTYCLPSVIFLTQIAMERGCWLLCPPECISFAVKLFNDDLARIDFSKEKLYPTCFYCCHEKCIGIVF